MAVGDDSAGANGQGSLAGIIDLGVEGGGTEDGGDLVDGSLQLTIVTGNGLVASNSNGDSSVGSNNVGLHGGGDGLVGDGLGGGDNGGGIRKGIGVSDNRGDNSGISISTPLAVVSVAIGVSVAVAVAETMSVVSAIKKVGISLGLRLGLSTPLAIVSKGGDNSGVLLDDGLAKAVGDDSAGANGQGSLAGIIDLGVKGGSTEDGGDLVDGSLQLTVVTGNGLVASNSNGGSSVGLHSGGDGLVGDGLGGGDNGGGVREGIGVSDNGGNNSGISISTPLAVVSVS